MRKLVWMNSVSLDGFIEGPDRELDWQLVDDELHWHFNELLAPAGVFLDGRVTYELMAGFWPNADKDPASTPPMVEFAGIWREKAKIVYSTTLDEAAWNATVVHAVIPDEVEALKAQAGGDLVLGGVHLAASFIAHDLIDEYRFYVHPVVIGRGTRLFTSTDTKLDLRLTETRTFGSGVVLLRYERPADARRARQDSSTAGRSKAANSSG